ncbi:MAG: hypothetical protein R2695_07815 [Acidimicrobiales bacterium]
MFSIGLVLSAGGPVGDPWHTGVVARLQETVGWDARRADLIVGTSAGSITGTRAAGRPVARRSGHPARRRHTERRRSRHRRSDRHALCRARRGTRLATHLPQDGCARRVAALAPPTRCGPRSPRCPGDAVRAALQARMNELMPGGWPSDPLWIVAVRVSDGRRGVRPRRRPRRCRAGGTGLVGDPGVYEPCRIGEREYVDGAVHSSTNADLVAPLGLDLVVVSSVMTASDAAAAG